MVAKMALGHGILRPEAAVEITNCIITNLGGEFMLPSASKFMKSIIILVGFICVVDNTTQLPQCSMVQEYFDSPKHCIQKTKDSVEFLN